MASELATVQPVSIADVLSTPLEMPQIGGSGAPYLGQMATPRKGLHPKGPTKDQKAAIIVRLLQSAASDLSLSDLNADTMTRLVHAMAGLSYVDEATTLQVIHDFLTEIDSLALYFQPGIHGAISTLDGHLDDEVTAGLTYVPMSNALSDPWLEISEMDIDDLLPILARETPQVIAIALSKLSSAKAAEVLAGLDIEQARAATRAALEIGRIELQAITDIGLAIAQTAAASADTGALPGDPVDRVGAMLNFTPGASREDLLTSLEASDPALADKVRKTMFTFGDIPDRVEVKDIPKLVRAVENDVMVTALAGGLVTDKETVEFIFANLSKRLVEQLEEEVREIGEVKPKDADTAMNTIIQGIRDLEAAREIILIAPEE